MSGVQELIFDVAHLGHVELLSPKPEESLWFFRDVFGMQEVARQGQSVYLRAWGEYELYSLKLTEAKRAGVAHVAFRAMSPQALERRVTALEASGQGRGWIDGDVGHGKAYQFVDPDEHLLVMYYATEKYRAPEHLRPALKNQPQRYTDHGVGVRRLDHVNFFGQNPAPNRAFMQERLGARLTEQIVLDDGPEAGVWLTFTNKEHDVVYTIDGTGSSGQNLSVEDQSALAERGAFLERCFTTPYTGKISWEQKFANIRATGPEHSFLSTDLGQPTNPPIEDVSH